VLGLAAVLAAAGCGTSDDRTLSRAEFLHRGNEICKEARGDILRTARQRFDDAGPATAGRLIKFGRQTVIPRLERQVAALGRLPVSPEDEDEVRATIAALQAALIRSKKKPLTFTLAKDSPYAKPDRLARDFGLTDCVSR
jgi:hypothetical protein